MNPTKDMVAIVIVGLVSRWSGVYNYGDFYIWIESCEACLHVVT
jgi:hypothetical protein